LGVCPALRHLFDAIAERIGIWRNGQSKSYSGFARGFVRIPYLVGCGLHLSENRVDSFCSVGRRETGARRNHACNQGAIVVAHSTIGRANDQDPRDFLT